MGSAPVRARGRGLSQPAFTAVLDNAKARGRLRNVGVTPSASTTQEFGRYLDDEIARWSRLICDKVIEGE